MNFFFFLIKLNIDLHCNCCPTFLIFRLLFSLCIAPERQLRVPRPPPLFCWPRTMHKEAVKSEASVLCEWLTFPGGCARASHAWRPTTGYRETLCVQQCGFVATMHARLLERSHLAPTCPGAAGAAGAAGAGHLLPSEPSDTRECVCVCVCVHGRFLLFPTEWNSTFRASEGGVGGWFYRLTLMSAFCLFLLLCRTGTHLHNRSDCDPAPEQPSYHGNRLHISLGGELHSHPRGR